MSEEAPLGLDRRLTRLEEIVARLEGSDLDLEEALALFEEGVAHLREARTIMREAELRVHRLLADDTGESVLEPLDDDV